MFADQSYFCTSGSHYWSWARTVFKERGIISKGQLIFWQVETIIFAIFHRLLPVMFQENPSFRAVETDSTANNGFHNKKEKL